MLHHKTERLKESRTRKKIFRTWQCSQMLVFQTGINIKKQKVHEAGRPGIYNNNQGVRIHTAHASASHPGRQKEAQ